jgi:hypothetical protein
MLNFSNYALPLSRNEAFGAIVCYKGLDTDGNWIIGYAERGGDHKRIVVAGDNFPKISGLIFPVLV